MEKRKVCETFCVKEWFCTLFVFFCTYVKREMEERTIGRI